MDNENANGTFKSREPIGIDKASGLVLTRRTYEGIRVTVGDVTVDVIVVQIKGKQVRLATKVSGEARFPIDRVYVKGSLRARDDHPEMHSDQCNCPPGTPYADGHCVYCGGT